MNPIAPIYNYTVEQHADHALLSYTKTPISKGLIGPLCFFTAIPAVFPTMMSHPTSAITGILMWLFWMATFGFVIVLFINYQRTKTPVQLQLNKNTIVSGGNTYDFSHISAIFLKNHKGLATAEASLLPTPMVNPHSLAGGIAHVSNGVLNMSRESVFAIKKYFNQVQYSVGIRYGSKEISIAKGLGEIEAQVLFEKIKQLTGYDKL